MCNRWIFSLKIVDCVIPGESMKTSGFHANSNDFELIIWAGKSTH